MVGARFSRCYVERIVKKGVAAVEELSIGDSFIS